MTRLLLIACALAVLAGPARAADPPSPSRAAGAPPVPHAAGAPTPTHMPEAPAAENLPAPVVTWDPAKPDIGNQIMLSVEIEVPADRLVTFPRLDDLPGGFAVTGRLAAEPEKGVTGQRRWKQSYRLEPHTTGEIALPDMMIAVHDPATMAEVRVPLTGIVIPVQSLVPAEADFRQIKDVRGPLALTVEHPSRWPWVLAGLAVVLAALAAVRLIPRRREAPAAPSQTPRDAALMALGSLDPGAESMDDNQRFHVEVAGILRTYLDRALGIGAPRQTTAEAVAAVVARSSADPEPLRFALGRCDTVKFARAVPPVQTRAEVLRAAMDFVGTGPRAEQEAA